MIPYQFSSVQPLFLTVACVYEYFITLDREVELFWTGRATSAAILFFLNRYWSLVTFLYNLAIFVPMSDLVNIFQR